MTATSLKSLTPRGQRTRRRILEAAEVVFAELGYAEASISRITERASVAQGTFYLYFDSKLAVFDELVEDLNARVREAMSEGAKSATTRLEIEREGFRAFFHFTAQHPSLYRIIREAEFVSPKALRLHYTRIVESYIEGLSQARDAGDIGDVDPTVAAWALMGIGEMIGMRWVLWPRDHGDGVAGADSDPAGAGTGEVPEAVFEEMMRVISGALGIAVAPRSATKKLPEGKTGHG